MTSLGCGWVALNSSLALVVLFFTSSPFDFAWITLKISVLGISTVFLTWYYALHSYSYLEAFKRCLFFAIAMWFVQWCIPTLLIQDPLKIINHYGLWVNRSKPEYFIDMVESFYQWPIPGGIFFVLSFEVFLQTCLLISLTLVAIQSYRQWKYQS